MKSWKAAISGIDKEQEVESFITLQILRKHFDAWVKENEHKAYFMLLFLELLSFFSYYS